MKLDVTRRNFLGASLAFLLPGGRCLSAIKEPKLIGDGKTDNTTAFRNLIQKANKGDTLNVPPGTYVISGTLDFSRLGSFSLIGAGSDRTTIVGRNCQGCLVKSVAQTIPATARIHGIKFVLQDGGNCCVHLERYSSSRLINCWFIFGNVINQ